MSIVKAVVREIAFNAWRCIALSLFSGRPSSRASFWQEGFRVKLGHIRLGWQRLVSPT
jgi:hypothetical protein